MPLAALATLLLAVVLVACGGGDESEPTTNEAASQGQAGKSDDAASKPKAKDDGRAKSTPEASDPGAEDSPGSFVPKQHEDSGGGSEQFKVKGGDNSVQEFGEEADPSAREAAATALHNFLDARAQGAWTAACSYLASSIVESLEKLSAQSKGAQPKDCAGILADLTNPAAKQELLEEAAEADVGSLRIEGDRAFVIYGGSGDVILAMPMTQEDGAWKVASLAGTPLN